MGGKIDCEYMHVWVVCGRFTHDDYTSMSIRWNLQLEPANVVFDWSY